MKINKLLKLSIFINKGIKIFDNTTDINDIKQLDPFTNSYYILVHINKILLEQKNITNLYELLICYYHYAFKLKLNITNKKLSTNEIDNNCIFLFIDLITHL